MSSDIRLSILLACLSGLFASTLFANEVKNNSTERVLSLNKDSRLDIKIGQSLFERIWVTAPASTLNADGLGPLYNARSCSACHPDNGRSRVPLSASGGSGFLMRVDIPPQNDAQIKQLLEKRINNVPDPMYGIQLHNFAISGHNAEYQLAVEFIDITLMNADGSAAILSKPIFNVNDLGYGALHPEVRLSPRLAPKITGLGLLEAIDEHDILKQVDPDDKNNDGISGRANWVWSHALSKVALGRFGFKAGLPSINEQVQHALLNDIGLSTPLFNDATGDCTVQQEKCQLALNGNSPAYGNLEANQQIVDLVNLYITHLPVPDVGKLESPMEKAGEKVFNDIGCHRCHTPQYTTGNNTQAKENHQRKIHPFTDMLLHDMGEGLADNRPEGDASGREWRTAPLWGIGANDPANKQNYYLHDGRARSILEAILWHGGEAQSQRDAVMGLDNQSREQLILFIEGL